MRLNTSYLFVCEFLSKSSNFLIAEFQQKKAILFHHIVQLVYQTPPPNYYLIITSSILVNILPLLCIV